MIRTLAVVAALALPIPGASYDENGERFCLAQNIYFESANQSFAGRLAVANVVMNRVEDPQFPNSVCEVVYQAEWEENWKGNMLPVKNRCQFSWFCDGKSDTPRNKKIYNRMYGLAGAILSNEISFLDITGGATHYHADYVSPAWAKTKTKTVEIQDHIFYRWEK